MAGRDAIVEFCNELLDIDSYPDGLPVGLQVPGADEVQTLVTGVSASLELFGRAAELGAQMVLVHHGMFYGSGPRPPIGAREKATAEGAVRRRPVAGRLPPGAGRPPRGRQQRAALRPWGGGARAASPGVGVTSASSAPPSRRSADLLLDTVRARDQARPAGVRGRPGADRPDRRDQRRRRRMRRRAADAGADCFLTGEPKEQVMNEAREAGHPLRGGRPLRHRGVRRAGAGRPAGRPVRRRPPVRRPPQQRCSQC